MVERWTYLRPGRRWLDPLAREEFQALSEYIDLRVQDVHKRLRGASEPQIFYTFAPASPRRRPCEQESSDRALTLDRSLDII